MVADHSIARYDDTSHDEHVVAQRSKGRNARSWVNHACKSLTRNLQSVNHLSSRAVRCWSSRHCQDVCIGQACEGRSGHDPVPVCAAYLLRRGVVHETHATPCFSEAVERFEPIAITGKDQERRGVAAFHRAFALDFSPALTRVCEANSRTARATVSA